MTFWELVRVLMRYWPIVLVGAVYTVACCFIAITNDGVYTTRTNILFQAPSTQQSNPLRTQSEEIIDTAGIVAKRVSGPGKVTKFATSEATLVGIGVRDGWSLRLPDTGGQWATNFSTQMLTLDVVGPSREVVQSRRAELIGRTQQELFQLQRDANVDQANDITAMPAPEASVIYYVGGNRPRAVGMTGVLGVGATLFAVLALDRWRRGRGLAPSVRSDHPVFA